MRKVTLGVIGLGNMGRGIAANIARAGSELAVWDIADRAMRPFEGKSRVRILEPAEMARRCSVIFFVVPGSPDIEALLQGENGILANARAGLVLVDLTTSDPAHTRRLARKAAGRGVAYLDAGMSGGASGADAGTLTLMIGGDAKAFRRTRRCLGAFAQELFCVPAVRAPGGRVDSGGGHSSSAA